MFAADCESLGTDQNSVLLSVGIVYFNPSVNPTQDELFENSIFVKFDVKEQVKEYHRVMNKSTMEWWNKQCDIVKRKSFNPSHNDLSLEHGINNLRAWIKKFPEYHKDFVWTRGGMDEAILDDVCVNNLGTEVLFEYNKYRDFRTAISILYNSTNGYAEIENESYDDSKIYKHSPVDDCVLDIMQLLYGKEKE